MPGTATVAPQASPPFLPHILHTHTHFPGAHKDTKVELDRPMQGARMQQSLPAVRRQHQVPPVTGLLPQHQVQRMSHSPCHPPYGHGLQQDVGQGA